MQKPSFVIMVSQGWWPSFARSAKRNRLCLTQSLGQGVTGGIPWTGFAFLPLYFQLSGFNDFRAGEIMLYGGQGGCSRGCRTTLVLEAWVAWSADCLVAGWVTASIAAGLTGAAVSLRSSPSYWALCSL